MIRAAVDSLQAGGQLIVFPEGTRSPGPGGTLHPLRPGLTLIAQRAGVPIANYGLLIAKLRGVFDSVVS